MMESRLKLEIQNLLGSLPYLLPNLLMQQQQSSGVQQQNSLPPYFIPPLLAPQAQAKQTPPPPEINTRMGFRLYASKGKDSDTTDSAGARTQNFEVSSDQESTPKIPELQIISKKISKKDKKKEAQEQQQQQSVKKIYEISRFFVKNYVGALKSTINNPSCEEDILEYLQCSKEELIKIRQELERLLQENPKHNRMQLFKLMTNPSLNSVFQYFLRKKVYAWIFTSSKMQDKYAHLMARKNFLYLCLNANLLTPNNFRIALNSK